MRTAKGKEKQIKYQQVTMVSRKKGGWGLTLYGRKSRILARWSQMIPAGRTVSASPLAGNKKGVAQTGDPLDCVSVATRRELATCGVRDG